MHDLATPLSSFGIALDLMRDPKREDYEEIHSSAMIALKQINEIIINGRDLIRNKVKKTHFSPSKLLEISLQILQNEIQVNGIIIENNIDQKIKVFGSPNLFIRISTNIILNAIQELHVTHKPIKKIIISTAQSLSLTTISIEDSGRGISEENLERIFEPDFSSKNSTGNLGFGLPFVRSTIKEHFKGEIRVVSEIGKFTRIELDFPNKIRKPIK